MSDSDVTSRRSFLGLVGRTAAAGAAAAIPFSETGCGPKAGPAPETAADLVNRYKYAKESQPDLNMYRILEQGNFIDQNGKPVIISSLKTKLQNKFTTLSFGFADCETVCPLTNGNLGKLGEARPDNLTSIIVSSRPHVDGISQAARNHFLEMAKNPIAVKNRGPGKVKHEVIILYPVKSNSTTPDPQQSKKLEALTKAMVNPVLENTHANSVTLHAPGGAYLLRQGGNKEKSEDFTKEWDDIVRGSKFKQP